MTIVEKNLLSLIKRDCIFHGDFTLASGIKSPHYIDIRKLQTSQQGLHYLGEAVYDKISKLDIDSIGGIVIGAVPIMAATLLTFHSHSCYNRDIKGFWIRNEAKSHGTEKLIEGFLSPEDKIVVLDDVVTSGQSTFKAITTIEAFGCKIMKVLSIVDRPVIRSTIINSTLTKYNYEAIFTINDLEIQPPLIGDIETAGLH